MAILRFNDMLARTWLRLSGFRVLGFRVLGSRFRVVGFGVLDT